MGEIEFSIIFTGLPDGRQIFAGVVIMMHAVGAISISEVNASISWVESCVGRHEFVSSPIAFGSSVFALSITTRIHGGSLIPNDITSQGKFGEGFHILISSNVEKLFFAFGSHLYPVASSLKLATKCSNEFSDWVKNKNTRMVFLIGPPLVHYIEVLFCIDSDIVGGLPGEFVRQLGEVMIYFILVVSFSNNDGTSAFLASRNVWESGDSSSEERRFFDKVAT